ncbi:lysine transporter LysE [Streptomyces sp. WAC06614]|uniref:lysine transporter LysE n=1 Tax=Streptomyces sp. WAC06614 TaxID=2487416 RepID=UPI000F79119D|nr:lysine transporter LysE [Streptomyces sp. WAC06614]RSS60688.1 lysine transporter LysE [Streptomyces sp. WAC06614]
MTELMTPALSGAAAGLGVAMPMGAISVLLLQDAMRHARTAVAAAAGVAAVDLAYAAVATAVGPWVAGHVTPVEAWVRLAAAAVLLAIAAHGLWTSRTRAGTAAAPADARAGTAAAPADAAAGTPAPAPAGAGRAFLRYVGLTAVNPTTALYFAALTTAQGAALGGGAAAAAFLGGVGVASLLWQQLLVGVGAFAGSRISGTARSWTFRLGYGLVAACAVKIALPLP